MDTSASIDLDRTSLDRVGPAPLFDVVMAVPIDDDDRLAAVIDRLAPEGVLRLRLSRRTPAVAIDAALARLRAQGMTITLAPDGAQLELVATRAPHDEAHPEVAAAALAALASSRATETGLRVRLARERQMLDVRLANVRNSTQYRLGDALISVARRPTNVIRFAKELQSLRRRRSRPEVSVPPTVSEFTARRSIRTGSILDEFSHGCLAPELELIPFRRADWTTQLHDLDLILVESAWQGNGGDWDYAVSQFDAHGDDLGALLEAAERSGVPTVFWNKEDPVAFDLFLPAARRFGTILTTDADLIEEYRREVGHERVACLPFAAQPLLHNPIGRARGSDVIARVAFAGAWRGDQYSQRRADLETVLRPPLERGVLDIYDRFADHESPERRFPAPFDSAVRGRLTYDETNAAYRRYAAFLNVNSVRESTTMFSRRVFELIACGTPVISTPALGIERLLGEHVLITDSPARTSELVEWVIAEPDQRDRHAHRGYRHVHTHHAYADRVDTMLATAGLSVPLPPARVSVICVSRRPSQLDHVIDTFASQTYADRELVFVAHGDDFDDEALRSLESRVAGAKVRRLDRDATLGDGLNQALAVADGAFFAKIDDDDLYGPDYLGDLMLTFAYSGAAVAGKQTYYAWLESTDRTVLRFPGHEFATARRVAGGTIVADRRHVDGIMFDPLPQGTDLAFLDAVRDRGMTLFSADRYNFCQVRHADPTAHTWPLDEEDFVRGCRVLGSGLARDEIFV